MIGDIRNEIKDREYGVAVFKTLFFLIPGVSLALLGSGFIGIISAGFAEAVANGIDSSEAGTVLAGHAGFVFGSTVTLAAIIAYFNNAGTDKDC